MGLLDHLNRTRRFGVKPGLERMRAVLAALGNPQDRVRAIHVAGTNGKGATCALLDAALRAQGLRAGRYTSPHLVGLTERFFLDGAPVPSARLEAAAARVTAIPAAAELTYFELLTAVAFALYAEEAGDDFTLVLETGLGGRLDATNAMRPENVRASVITRIGLDHCDWLGRTIPEIAAEKAGIVKDGVPVVCGETPSEARAVVEAAARAHGAPFTYAPDAVRAADVPGDLALDGAFNRENAVTACAALDALGLKRVGFGNAVWPGRFQRVVRGGVAFRVDGAHNPPALTALAASWRETESPRPVAVCGFCGDKDVAANLAILKGLADEAFAVRIANPRSMAAADAAAAMAAAGMKAEACGSVPEALRRAADRARERGAEVLVCGSLFLAGEALVALGAWPWPAELATAGDPVFKTPRDVV
ncbi:MAG: bifunctional folylpolyglutamate synthase/dihydrofolate synthase [Kiritimatiellae bacterium]|nr:bifunctional folylpolyglutamate synthase/dihydrofolate synthase [Kiritimatiellia bacterium]